MHKIQRNKKSRSLRTELKKQQGVLTKDIKDLIFNALLCMIIPNSYSVLHVLIVGPLYDIGHLGILLISNKLSTQSKKRQFH